MKQNDVLHFPEVAPPSRPLRVAGRALWDSVMREYAIADSGGRELLLVAAEATDRAQMLREAIDRDGVTVPTTTGGIREHPALRAEVAAQALAVRALARLGLDVEPVGRIGRPTSTKSLSWRNKSAD